MCYQPRWIERQFLFREYTATHKPVLFLGVAEFVTQATADFLVAIASGGRHEQIDEALRGTPIEQSFAIILWPASNRPKQQG